MRKISVVLSCVFIFVWTGHAQPKFEIGARVGESIAYQTWKFQDLDTNMNALSGIDAGLFLNWLATPFFDLSAQLSYVQKGTGMRFQLGPHVYDIRNRLDYASLEILPEFHLDEGIVRISAFIGPRMDFKIRYVSEVEGDVLDIETLDLRESLQRSLESQLEQHRKNELGLSCGLGLGFSLTSVTRVGIEGRFNPDIQNAYSYEFVGSQGSQRNTSFSVLATVAVRLGE